MDQARAERDVALAQIARTKAIIARKTIRAPFRARVGIADVHPGQYLNEGTELTTLQGVDDAVHVDFTVAQRVAAGLASGDTRRRIVAGERLAPIAGRDRRDRRARRSRRPATPSVRAQHRRAPIAPAPGASVRVRVPVGPPRTAVAVPVSALRKGPGGDHVFVIAPDKDGKPRAHVRPVAERRRCSATRSLILDGLEAGEQVAASGSFKLREAVLVAIADADSRGRSGDRARTLIDGPRTAHALVHRHLHPAPGARGGRQPRASCSSAGGR